MRVTATEFKLNTGKYFKKLKNEDIILTKNGKKFARIKAEIEDNKKDYPIESIFGVLKGESITKNDIEKAREEYLVEKYESISR